MNTAHQGKVLIADDDEAILTFLDITLNQYNFEVAKAKDGEEALSLLKSFKPDIVLLDINMPKIDGFQVLSAIKNDKKMRLVPVIMLTAYVDEEEKALLKGASDFLSKPFSMKSLMARINSHMHMKKYTDQLEDIDDLLYLLAKIAEAKDGYTESHLKRVRQYSLLLGNKIKLDENDLLKLERGAVLHDIGKIGVPDKILLKAGKFTVTEYENMKEHTIVGWRICSTLRTLKDEISLIPKYHQERWDGKGYPEGLKGDEIPLIVRIVTLCDAFDAMTTDRPYRKRLSYEQAFSEIERVSGKQFDPELAKVFLSSKEEILKIAEE